jgi:hypothetical protein
MHGIALTYRFLAAQRFALFQTASNLRVALQTSTGKRVNCCWRAYSLR